MSNPIYDPAETALVDAIIREFGEGAFDQTGAENLNALPFHAEDGSIRLQLGGFTFWLDDAEDLCFGVQLGNVLYTGRSVGGKREFDEPGMLGEFSLN